MYPVSNPQIDSDLFFEKLRGAQLLKKIMVLFERGALQIIVTLTDPLLDHLSYLTNLLRQQHPFYAEHATVPSIEVLWMAIKFLLLATAIALHIPSSAMAQASSVDDTHWLHNLHLHYSETLGLTGCSPLGESSTFICLGWQQDSISTCLQWTVLTTGAACLRRAPSSSPSTAFPLELLQGPDVLPFPSNENWGYRFNLSLP